MSSITCPATTVGNSSAAYDLFSSPGRAQYITCYSLYRDGQEGENITRALEGCCQSKPIVIDNIGRTEGACLFLCNATSVPAANVDKASAFWSLETCLQREETNFRNNTYGIHCLPRLNTSSSSKTTGLGKTGLVVLMLAIAGLVA